jgi:hypothetical protein
MPVTWYSSLVLISLLGVALVVYSRYENQHPAPAVQPAVGTHWFEALGFDVCGTIEPNLPANPNASKTPIPGIRTNGDGAIQTAPITAKDAGDNATLARFVALYPKLTVTPTRLQLPGSAAFGNGQRCPTGTPDAGKAGIVQIRVWPSFTPPGSNNPVLVHDPSAVKLADRQLITVAFVPADASIPKPSAKAITAMLTDGAASSSSATTAVPSSPLTTGTVPVTAATTPPTTATTQAKSSPSSTLGK